MEIDNFWKKQLWMWSVKRRCSCSFGKGVVSHRSGEKIQVHSQDEDNDSLRDLIGAVVEEDAREGEDNVDGAVAFCLQPAVYSVTGKETVEYVHVLGRKEVAVKAGGLELMLGDDGDGDRVLQIEIRTEEKKPRE